MSAWADCRFLTCSVLPVRRACNLSCPFCFSKSSVSALDADRADFASMDVESYYRYARERGATRLVITGGGEPLLRRAEVLSLIARGRPYFDEIACFSNGTHLDPALAEAMAEAGLSYLCWSRHHHDDATNRELMGPGAPALRELLGAAGSLRIRATCVMAQGYIDSREAVERYLEVMAAAGVREITFKHTYVAYARSVFGGSVEDHWAQRHQVELDPFADRGEVIGALPWGPKIRRLGELQVCYYHEPTPAWEKEHRLCRSTNLLSDGSVYASLEDAQSLLFRLSAS